MSTADKLTYLNDTKGLIKDSINLGGGNLTTEPFRQYATTLKNIYKDFLANGIGTLWNNWEKVTGTGTSLSLSPTIQGEMEFTYKGNTSQNGTPTPSSPIPINVVSGDNEIVVRGKSLIDLANYSSKDTIVTTSFTNNNLLVSISSGTYGKVLYDVTSLFKANQGKKINIRYDSINLTSYTGTSSNTLIQIKRNSTNTTLLNAELTKTIYTIPSDITDSDVFQIAIFGSGSSSDASSVTYNKLMFYFGEESAFFEPYIGNSYPIYLGVENLFNYALFNDFTSGNQTLTLTLKPNTTYTMSSNIPAYSVDSSANLFAYNSTSSPSTNTNGIKPNVPRQITTNADGIVKVTYRNLGDELIAPKTTYWYQIELGSKANHYTPYGTTPIELCKIGTYQDYIYKTDKWYLHKEIGKYVYDNDLGENGISGNVVSLLTPEVNIQANISDDGLYENAYCNLLPAKRIKGTGLKGTTSSKRIRIETKGYGNDYATIRALLVGLIIYFPLEIPTNTPITDTTLINQLEESKLSYISQTNISQVNNDLPFNLVVKALKNI